MKRAGPGQRVDWLASRALGVPRMIASLPRDWAVVQGLAPTGRNLRTVGTSTHSV